MRRFLQRLPYPPLIIVALFLGLAPFTPEPHLIEKLRMLVDGQLHRPLDLFDLVMHSAPLGLLLLKLALGRQTP